jgi:hypothetical protein
LLVMARRRKNRQPDEESRPSRWNRLNLRFFGPPHVGPYEGPYPEVDQDPACPFCGRPESEHETFRTDDGKTLRRCPQKRDD